MKMVVERLWKVVEHLKKTAKIHGDLLSVMKFAQFLSEFNQMFDLFPDTKLGSRKSAFSNYFRKCKI